MSGNRSSPTVPARKKKAPAQTAKMVETIEREAHAPSASERAAPLTKATEMKAASNAKISATSTAAGTLVACAQQQQRGDAAGAEQLRRHDAVGIAWPPQDADQTQRHHRQHETRGGEQEVSHRWAPLR